MSDSEEEIEVVEAEWIGVGTYDLAAAVAAAAQTAAEMEAAASRQLKRKRKDPPQSSATIQQPPQQQQSAPVPVRSLSHANGHGFSTPPATTAPSTHSLSQPPQPRDPPPPTDSFLHQIPRALHDSLQNEILHLIFPNRVMHGSHLYRNLPGPQPVSITRSQLGPLSAHDYW